MGSQFGGKQPRSYVHTSATCASWPSYHSYSLPVRGSDASIQRMQRRLALLAAILGGSSLLVVSPCGKNKTDPHQLASRSECEALAAKERALLPVEMSNAVPLGIHMEAPSERRLAQCQERNTSEVVACVLAAATMDEALACKPSVEIRPPSVRRSMEECARYVEHVRQIVAQAAPGRPEMVANLGQAAGIECDRYLTRERYECVLATKGARDWAACPP